MSWVPAEQVLHAVNAQRQILAAEEGRIHGFVQHHATERQKIEAEHRQAVRALGEAILPRLDAASIAAAAQATGMNALPSENIPAKVEGRRAWLAARLGEIGRDPRVANREMLRHPRTGSLIMAIAAREAERRPFGQVISACEEHARFERLWTTGFGSPDHKGSWWRFSHWQDRSAAEEIVKRFPGVTTFAEVRDAYLRAKQSVVAYDADLGRLRAEVAAGEALDREHAAVYEEHRMLDAKALDHTRGRIIQHMLRTDTSIVSQRLRASSPLLLLFMTASGLAAKMAYLDGIQKTNIAEMQKEIAAQRARLDSAEARTRRRWAPMPVDKYQKLCEDRRPRYEKRWQRFGKVYTTVHAYNRWDRGRYYDDLLWWDLMTRGRHDGSYLPDVVEFRMLHPDYQFDPNWKDRAAARRTADLERAEEEDFVPDDDGEAGALAIEADTSTGADADDMTATDAS